MWVKASVGGYDAFGILNTGADGTAIDSKVASTVGKVARVSKVLRFEADEFELAKSGPTSFNLGAVQLHAKQVYLLPAGCARGESRLHLGVDLFAQTPFTIGYTARRIELGWRAGREASFASSKTLGHL